MKTKILLLLIAPLLLCACEKVDLDDYLGNGDTYPVTFSMNAFSQSDFSDGGTRATRNLADIATVLNFAVFKNGEKVKAINQKNDAKDFGKIELSLAQGTYQVVAVAHSCAGNATISAPEKITFPSNKLTDTFSFYRELTISDKESYDCTMERVVSMFRLVVEQEIPSQVAQMKFYYTGGSSTLDATSGYGCVNSRQTEIRDVVSNAKNQTFEVYTFPHDDTDELTMTITALLANGDALKERSLTNVPIAIRKITTYKGNFFDESSEIGASNLLFVADDEWEGEDEYPLD